MPTYEYICEDCGCNFEQFQSITARPLRVCPMCKKRELKRLIGTGSGVIFKGSGFYQTDYRSESYRKAEKSATDTAEKKTETNTKDSKTPSKSKKDTKDKKKSA